VTDQVVVVSRRDRRMGVVDKLAAHRLGVLHRALSIFVFDESGRLMLQRRAVGKYHSAGQWSNTCCTHPRPGEPVVTAAHRRLREEMGFDCPLRRLGSFVYRARLDNGMLEHELDHLFVGRFEGTPAPNPGEVMDWRWVTVDGLAAEMGDRPGDFTPWFALAWNRLELSRTAARRLGTGPV
jgi:isopentenyl-diphosphate Delta-isomerase